MRYYFITKLLFLIMLPPIFLLSSCASLKKELYDCTKLVSVIKEGSIVDIKTNNYNDLSIVRFNGIESSCYNKNNLIYSEVKIGLKVSREINNNNLGNVDEVEVPFILAILDNKENVILNDSFGYKITFPSGEFSVFPKVKFKYKFPINSRIIISLTSLKVKNN